MHIQYMYMNLLSFPDAVSIPCQMHPCSGMIAKFDTSIHKPLGLNGAQSDVWWQWIPRDYASGYRFDRQSTVCRPSTFPAYALCIDLFITILHLIFIISLNLSMHN
jgi:hypothetical protein